MLKADNTGTNINCVNTEGVMVNVVGVMAEKVNEYFKGNCRTLSAKIPLTEHFIRQ